MSKNIFDISLEKLNSIFEQNNVILAYVFGSFVYGTITPLSDLDIAVVFDEKVPNKERFDRRLRLSYEIGKLTEMDRVDVVDLEAVRNPLLKHDAALEGKVIFSKNKEFQREFELKILQEYEDTEFMRRIQYYYLRKHIKEGTFGKPIISLNVVKTPTMVIKKPRHI